MENVYPVAPAFFISMSLALCIFTAIIYLYHKLRLERILHHSDMRWRHFIQNIPFVVVALNHEGRIVDINTFGVRLLGYDEPEQLINANWFDAFALSCDTKILKKIHADVLENR